MPELPEVETTRRGIAPHITGQQVTKVLVHHTGLRWPIPADELCATMEGKVLQRVDRRAKYLRLIFADGEVLVHLGMSGSLRVLPPTDRGAAMPTPAKHDHVELHFANGRVLRFHDPRRFGCWLPNHEGDAHPLLRGLGPEPLEESFTGEYLRATLGRRKGAIKAAIMDQGVVVGVGNIYASESLFLAGIHPRRAANRVSTERLGALAEQIKYVLTNAIDAGGTTLRDFLRSDGQPGYFALQLNVYGRSGEPCPHCGSPIRDAVIGGRNSFWCPRCQR